jgi:hypothetical protein
MVAQPKKVHLNSHMKDFYGTSSENPVEQWSQILLNETQAHKTLSRVEMPFYCHVSNCTPSGHDWIHVTSSTCYRKFSKFSSQ